MSSGVMKKNLRTHKPSRRGKPVAPISPYGAIMPFIAQIGSEASCPRSFFFTAFTGIRPGDVNLVLPTANGMAQTGLPRSHTRNL